MSVTSVWDDELHNGAFNKPGVVESAVPKRSGVAILNTRWATLGGGVVHLNDNAKWTVFTTASVFSFNCFSPPTEM